MGKNIKTSRSTKQKTQMKKHKNTKHTNNIQTKHEQNTNKHTATVGFKHDTLIELSKLGCVSQTYFRTKQFTPTHLVSVKIYNSLFFCSSRFHWLSIQQGNSDWFSCLWLAAWSATSNRPVRTSPVPQYCYFLLQAAGDDQYG